MLMNAPQEKGYCENTTKPATSYSFHDPEGFYCIIIFIILANIISIYKLKFVGYREITTKYIYYKLIEVE